VDRFAGRDRGPAEAVRVLPRQAADVPREGSVVTEAPDSSLRYAPIAVSDESTVVAAYVPDPASAQGYQSEAALEQEFVAQLQAQAYERLTITSAADLEANLRRQLEILNDVTFSDDE